MPARSAAALGAIELPAPRSIESGIGIIGGWYGGAAVIQMQVDDGESLTAGSRDPRGDTVAACGRADTGFALLFNYGVLSPGRVHKLAAFADGIEFAEEKQRFSSTGVNSFSRRGVSGTYLGAFRQRLRCDSRCSAPRFGTFAVRYRRGGKLTFSVTWANGGACTFTWSSLDETSGDGQITAFNRRPEPATFTGDCRDLEAYLIRVDGTSLSGSPDPDSICFGAVLNAAKAFADNISGK